MRIKGYSQEQIRAIAMEESRKKEEINNIINMCRNIHINQYKILSILKDFNNNLRIVYYLTLMIIGLILGLVTILIFKGCF